MGLTLYELLALRPAYDEHDRQRLIQVVTQEQPSRLRKLNPAVPRDLATVIHKAIAREPDHRYATAAGLGEDLQRFIDDKPIRARHIRPLERLARWGRRNPTLAGLTAAVLLLLVAVAGVASLAAWRLNGQRDATRDQLRLTQQAEAEANHRLYRSLVEQARGNRLSRRIGQRFETLETVRKAAALARQLGLPEERFLELRNEAIAALALPDLRVAKEWPHGHVLAVRFDGSCERYACAGGDGTVQVWRVGGEQPMFHLTGMGPGDLGPVLSADGRYLSVWEPGRSLLHVWRLAGVEPSLLFSEPASGAVSISRDNQWLALQEPDGALAVYDLATNTKVRRIPDVPRAVHVVWHPNGDRLALAGDGFAQVRDPQTGEILWHKKLANLGWRYVEWHPNGTTLAVMDLDTIALWDVKHDKQVGRLDGSTAGGSMFAFNPAGSLLASNGWDGILRLYDPLTGRQLFRAHAPHYWVQFSADGRFLAATLDKHKLRIWEVAAGSEYRTIISSHLPGKRGYGYVAASPNGYWLAAAVAGGIVLWDLPSGRELAFRQDSPFNFVAFEKGATAARVDGVQEAALLSKQSNGLFRLPIRVEQEGHTVQVGPAEKLSIPGAAEFCFDQSRDGRVLAAAQGWGALVWRADQPEALIKLEGQKDVRHVGVSLDGRWVATARWAYPGGIKIWQLKSSASGLTYEFVKDLPDIVGLRRPVFSPDGKHLLAAAGPDVRPVRRFEVDSWAEMPFLEPVVGQNPTFSPDGKLIALETGAGAAQLIDAETGREYARLEDPDQHRTHHFAFTPDGATAACATDDGYCIHLWNLRMIREELARLKLDWQLPAYLPADENSAVPVTSVVVEPWDSASCRARGELLIKTGETAQAAEAIGQAFEIAPDDVLLGCWWASLLLVSGDVDGYRRACAAAGGFWQVGGCNAFDSFGVDAAARPGGHRGHGVSDPIGEDHGG